MTKATRGHGEAKGDQSDRGQQVTKATRTHGVATSDQSNGGPQVTKTTEPHGEQFASLELIHALLDPDNRFWDNICYCSRKCLYHFLVFSYNFWKFQRSQETESSHHRDRSPSPCLCTSSSHTVSRTAASVLAVQRVASTINQSITTLPTIGETSTTQRHNTQQRNKQRSATCNQR